MQKFAVGHRKLSCSHNHSRPWFLFFVAITLLCFMSMKNTTEIAIYAIYAIHNAPSVCNLCQIRDVMQCHAIQCIAILNTSLLGYGRCPAKVRTQAFNKGLIALYLLYLRCRSRSRKSVSNRQGYWYQWWSWVSFTLHRGRKFQV